MDQTHQSLHKPLQLVSKGLNGTELKPSNQNLKSDYEIASIWLCAAETKHYVVFQASHRPISSKSIAPKVFKQEKKTRTKHKSVLPRTENINITQREHNEQMNSPQIFPTDITNKWRHANHFCPGCQVHKSLMMVLRHLSYRRSSIDTTNMYLIIHSFR